MVDVYDTVFSPNTKQKFQIRKYVLNLELSFPGVDFETGHFVERPGANVIKLFSLLKILQANKQDLASLLGLL